MSDTGSFYRPGAGVKIEAMPTESAFFQIAELPSFEPLDGVEMSVMSGARSMANWVRIEPGVSVPAHSHPHEQIGLVLEGTIELRIGDDTRLIGTGVSYVIAGGVEHAATAGEDGCLVLDIFSPPREDYLASVTG